MKIVDKILLKFQIPGRIGSFLQGCQIHAMSDCIFISVISVLFSVVILRSWLVHIWQLDHAAFLSCSLVEAYQ